VCDGIGDVALPLRAWQLCVVLAKCIIEFTRLFHCGPGQKVSFSARLNAICTSNALPTHHPDHLDNLDHREKRLMCLHGEQADAVRGLPELHWRGDLSKAKAVKVFMTIRRITTNSDRIAVQWFSYFAWNLCLSFSQSK